MLRFSLPIVPFVAERKFNFVYNKVYKNIHIRTREKKNTLKHSKLKFMHFSFSNFHRSMYACLYLFLLYFSPLFSVSLSSADPSFYCFICFSFFILQLVTFIVVSYYFDFTFFVVLLVNKILHTNTVSVFFLFQFSETISVPSFFYFFIYFA